MVKTYFITIRSLQIRSLYKSVRFCIVYTIVGNNCIIYWVPNIIHFASSKAFGAIHIRIYWRNTCGILLRKRQQVRPPIVFFAIYRRKILDICGNIKLFYKTKACILCRIWYFLRCFAEIYGVKRCSPTIK